MPIFSPLPISRCIIKEDFTDPWRRSQAVLLLHGSLISAAKSAPLRESHTAKCAPCCTATALWAGSR